MRFNPPRSAAIIAIVVAISAVALAALWLVDGAMETRGAWAATEDLLAMKQAPRETGYPGVTAWLQKLLHQYCQMESGPDVRAECDHALSKLEGLPENMTALQTYFTESVPEPKASAPTLEPVLIRSHVARHLCAAEFKVGNQRYAVTQPRRAGECNQAKNSFVTWAIKTLESRGVPNSMKVPPFGTLVVERAYIIAQDGSLISRRFSDQITADIQQGRDYQEYVRAGDSESSPAIISVKSFFPIAKPSVAYSGAYLDVTDLGFVSTPMALVRDPEGEEVVIALDVAFGTEWVTRLVKRDHDMFWMDVPNTLTWGAVAEQAAKHSLPDVNAVARRCGEAERHFEAVALCESQRSNRDGMIAAIRVGNGDVAQGKQANRWLIAWMPPLSSPLRLAEIIPILAILLGAAAYLLLDRKHSRVIWAVEADRAELARLREASGELGAEIHRSQAERAQLSHALEDARLDSRNLGNLFENLNVAILTLDPNDDRIRYQNGRSRILGLVKGAVFRSYVHRDDQSSYDAANKAAGTSERAYGVRLQIDSRVEQAVIRSIVIPDPIPVLNARGSDRLGLVALLSHDDTDVWQTRIEQAVIDLERDRLGAILTHGLAMLTEVACRSKATLDESIHSLLLAYLERRVGVITELFAGWQKPLEERPLAPILVSKKVVEAIFTTLQRLAALVARDRDLREQLRWSNGVLSLLPADLQAFKVDLTYWPDDLPLTTRVEGAESFIFEELLINAFKHGRPGVPPVVAARPPVNAPDTRWVEFEISNEVRSPEMATEAVHKYGGRRLVQEACRRIGWELAEPTFRDSIYSITVRARAIEARGPPA